MVKRRRHRFAAFTLIEVLVVVAVIALLVSVLLPALSRSRESARRVACRSKARDIAMAMLYHANDNKGVYIYSQGGTSYSGTPGADDGLQYIFNKKYLRDPKVTICPSTDNVVDISKKGGLQLIKETDQRITLYTDLAHGARNRFDHSGGHSYEVFSKHSAGIFPGGLRYDQSGTITVQLLKRPYQQFILVDSDQDPDKSGAGGIVDGLGVWAYNNWPDEATNNHGKDGGNIAFLDGHAGWVTKREWVPAHLKSAHLAWPEQLARETYFPNLKKEPRKDGGDGYVWTLN
jgi:prepilin-type N-terminal cleavage/methylation domain-containing protein/prepilin-type processing-associated H-X9-DG protein